VRTLDQAEVPAEPGWQPWRLEDASAVVAAVQAADELGIIRHLEATPSSAARLAAELDLDPRMTELLLDALDVASVVERDLTGTYRGRLTTGRLLLQESVWGGLADAVRTGRPVIDVTDKAVAMNGYSHVVEHLSRLTDPARTAVVEALRPCGPRLLDIGAGAAPWSRALAAVDPSLEVVALDLPGVVDVTERVVAADGLSDRFRCVAGDMFTADVGGDFDVVLVAGVGRLFGAGVNERLAQHVAALLRPGGTLVILDALPDVDRADDGRIGLYALSLSIRTAGGAVHPFSSYATWLYNAGLTDIDLSLLPIPELSLIRATRPL